MSVPRSHLRLRAADFITGEIEETMSSRILGVFAILVAVLAHSALAEDIYPSRMTLLVGYPPGG